MVLYHFTFRRHLDNIVAEGLKPGTDDVVWMTTNPEAFHPVGLTREGHIVDIPPEIAHDVRITLVIPSHDRRLINYRRRLHKRGGPEKVAYMSRNPYLGPERSRRTLQDWHCYSGTVPPDRFREISNARRHWIADPCNDSI
jgi:hypothetical protein